MKPLLLGMCNTLSDDPEYDLYPYPEGSAGWRLWKMLPEGTARKQYLDAFDRRNLLRVREWNSRAAKRAGRVLLPELRGRLVVVLGMEVRVSLGLEQAAPLDVRQSYVDSCGFVFEIVWVAFPHPSGHNRWFNEPNNYEAARLLFARIFSGDLVNLPVPRTPIVPPEEARS